MTLSQLDQNVSFPLTNFSLIKISGPDSEKFLQGQLTCDIHQVKPQSWVLGACCTAKGRMVANFALARIDDVFYLRVASSIADGLITHLKKYAVFFKTSLQLSDLQIYGQLPAQVEMTRDETASLKLHNGDIEVGPTLDTFSIHWPDNRREYWLPAALSPESAALAPGSAALSEKMTNAWQQADILSGLYWITAEHTDQWIPQHIAWDQLGGVSFNKGCYTGQEIIARLQYLGKSKKSMALVVANSQPKADINDQKITSVNDDNGRAVATILDWSGTCGLVISSYDEITPVTLLSQQDETFEASLIPLMAPISEANSGD